MADTATKPHKPVKPIDFSKPFHLVVSQSAARNMIEVFDGADSHVMATVRARALAASTDRPAAVVGPQSAVYLPPPPAQVQALPLDFTA